MRNERARTAVGIVCLASLLGGCAPRSVPPIVERSHVLETSAAGTYRVRAGDSLYSIAWRHGLDYRALARANGIGPPYTIRVGQELRLTAKSEATATPSPAPRGGGWSWPVDAAPLRDFRVDGKGLDYELARGDEIRVSAEGDVVYAGHGVGAFRHLVIVRHGAAYLSAYSMNVAPRVREGEHVGNGARLARIKDARGPGRLLHFEIRRDGKPLDPARLIGS